MGALYGSLSALFIGISDLFGRKAIARSSTVAAAVVLQTVAIGVSLVAVALFGGVYRSGDLVIGLISGLGMGAGLGTYYAGLAASTSTVVAPVVATLSAVIPFGYAIVRGAHPSAFALFGSAVALAGLLLITMGGGRAAHVRQGLIWGVAAGIAYGIAFAVVIEASHTTGAWPAVGQRVGAAGILAAFARYRKLPLTADWSARRLGALGGVFAGLCAVFYLAGVRVNPTAAVITSSMFPAASVAIGRVFFRDSVARPQVVGLVVVLAGIVGVAVG